MKKKIKDLTLEERKTICDKYCTDCFNCPLCAGEEDFGKAICGDDIIDWVNEEIEVKENE